MPAGTWNLGRLRKKADYVGLKDLGISNIDTTVNSDKYFNISYFPTQLTGGKNLFKIRANANTLVKDSKIHIEVLDSNGNPLYYEPINYLEADGTRVVAVYVYPDAPYGTATVYVAGRARVDQNGNQLRSSKDYRSRDYFNFPNVLWSRSVTVAPERLNSTEIIFTQKPQLTLQEVVQPYLQPVNLTNVATQSFGIGTCTIKPKPGSFSTTQTVIPSLSFPVLPVSFQGSGTSKSPPSFLGTQIQANPASFALAAAGGNASDKISAELGPVVATTTQLITALDESIFETSTPFFTSDMGPGDVITIHNPNIEIPGIGAQLTSDGLVLPNSQTSEGFASAAPNLIHPLSGSYNFVIDNVLNTTKAQVVLLDQPPGFKNISDANTGGKWSVDLKADKGTQTVDEVKATANYTCSFTLPYVLQMTEQSQSFAEIKLANIEPSTGDVYKLKTFYKAGGQFGDFIDAGETILEQIEILEDPYEYEANASDGANYNRMGFFSSLEDYKTYFTGSGGIIDPTIGITETFEPDDLLSGIRLTPDSNYGPDDFSYIRLKDEYDASLTKNTQYLMTVNLFGDNSYTSTDPNVSTYPQLDIYVSGSKGSFRNDEMTVNAYIKQPFATQISPSIPGYEDSLTGIFESEGIFGTRIGSVQVNDSGSIVPAIFRFESLLDQDVEFYFVQRNGRFNVGNISIKTFNESKFTPNFTKINTRIPSQFLKTPLTFKIIFFDYLNQQAETEALIYPVTFTGENVVVGGENNLFTGSIYIGNSVGSGIELAGVNSGYIRSVGYEGFISASKPENAGGFMIYTGSVLPGAPDGYTGTGLEIVENSESFLRFSTGNDPGLSIKTPNFFLGSLEAGNFISGSNGNIEITSSNFHLDRDGDVVLQGTITADAGGSIGGFEIQSSSLSTDVFSISSSQNNNDPVSFISSSNFKVSAGGTITGSAVLLGSKGGGNYLEFDDDTLTVQGNITVDNIRTPATIGGIPSTITNASSSINSDGFAKFASASIASFEIVDSEIKSSDENLRLKSSGQITGSQVQFLGGDIGGWQIASNAIKKVDSTGGIQFHSTNRNITIRTGSLADTNVLKIGNLGSNKYGIQGLDQSGNEIFKLGENGNEIAGWTLSDTSLIGGSMIIRKTGTIESANFASNVAGSGFRLTANDGGFLEVENARIRGTLSTAVFEKEAVNAVGGQLYVANSSVLTGSAVAPNGVHTSTTTTMSLENVSGFSPGEILTAKKVDNTGFATEYIRVTSASRFEAGSDTNFAGFIFVERGYSGSSTNGDTGSLGDIASNAQSYSGSQVIVSTGKVGTGYIRLNANPNDPTTPYIDIVERTGSAIYDIDLKARLGDLSGLSQARLHGKAPEEAGFGLYSQNVFLEGGIVANTGSIGGINMLDNKLFTGEGVYDDADTGFFASASGKFSLGDKLSWDGTNLIVKGQLQLSDGTTVETGTDGAPGEPGRSLAVSLDSNVMSFASSSDNTADPNSIIFSVSQQNLATVITSSDITITTATGQTVQGFSYNTAGVSGSISQALFSGIGSGSFTYDELDPGNGGLGNDKSAFPVTISVTTGSASTTTHLTDVTTLFKIEGGTGGSDGAPGADGVGGFTFISSNESHTFAADANGGGIDFSGASTDVLIFEGITDKLKTYSVHGVGSDGVDVNSKFISNSSSSLDVYAMAHDSGSVTLTAVSGGIHQTGYGDNDTQLWSSSNLVTGNIGNIVPDNAANNKWHKFQSNGPVSFGTGDGELYGNYMQFGDNDPSSSPTSDQWWISGNDIVVYDDTKVYSIEARLKQSGTDISDPGKIYVGVTGHNGTSTRVNITGANNFSSQHYIAASGYVPTGSDWFTVKGYFSGHDSSGNGGFHPDINDPGTIHDDASHVAPMLLVNYLSKQGQVRVDYIAIKEVKDAAGNLSTGSLVAAKTMSLAKSKAGTSGTSAKLLSLEASSLVFVKATDGSITPSSIGFTSSLQNTADSTATFTSNPSVTLTSGTDANHKSITSGNFGTNTSVKITATADSGAVTDTVSVLLLEEGSGAITANLSNESHTMPASALGAVTSYSNSGTTISVFEGATALDYDGNGSSNGHWTIATPTVSPAGKITVGSISDSTNDAVVANHSSMANDTDSVTITYTISGKTQTGTPFSFTKTQTLTKSTAGADGSPGAQGPTGPTFDFLTGSLDSVNTTGGISAGLLQTSQVFGYHKPIAQGSGPPYNNAQLSDFTSYLDAGGNFYLGGNASGISASGDFGYFAWNNSDRSLLISGSAVNIEVDQFYLGRTDQYISGSGGNIEIKSSTFHLERDGDLNMQGNVTASGIMIDGNSTFKGAVEIANGSGVPGSNLYQHGPLSEHPRSSGTPNNEQLPNATWNAQADNAIEYVVGPMGGQELAITAYPDSVSNNDGGFNSNKIEIDPTCGYMFVIYMKRTTNSTHGAAYFGTHGYDENNSAGFILNNSGGTTGSANINPYFMSGDVTPHGETAADAVNRWFLHVGYVYPSGSLVDASRKSSVYDLTTGLAATYSGGGSGSSFMWTTGTYSTILRAYHFYNANGDGQTKYQEFARPGIYKMDGSEPSIQSLLSNTSAGGSTQINGAAITTGMIQSANVSDTEGSRINLADGTILMGGTGSNAGFAVDSSGFVTATNFREKLVVVTNTNKSQYFSDNGADGVNLLFDGSGGGDVTMNMQLNVAPQLANGTIKPIQDILLPSQAGGTRISVGVIINTTGVQFDEGTLASTMGNLAKA